MLLLLAAVASFLGCLLISKKDMDLDGRGDEDGAGRSRERGNCNLNILYKYIFKKYFQ